MSNCPVCNAETKEKRDHTKSREKIKLDIADAIQCKKEDLARRKQQADISFSLRGTDND